MPYDFSFLISIDEVDDKLLDFFGEDNAKLAIQLSDYLYDNCKRYCENKDITEQKIY